MKPYALLEDINHNPDDQDWERLKYRLNLAIMRDNLNPEKFHFSFFQGSVPSHLRDSFSTGFEDAIQRVGSVLIGVEAV